MTVHITEKIIINKPINEVFEKLLDYDAFIAWNPWHKFDTEMNITMHTPNIGVGSGYAWESKIVGAGNITTVVVRENEEIEQDLEFFKPMKSKAKTYLITKKIDDNSTEVSWKMTTHMPFFAIFFLNTFKSMMHSDYKLGLIMFASLFDDTAPKYTFDVGTPIHKESLTIVTLPFSGMLSSFKKEAGKLYGALVEECTKNNIEFSAMGHAVTKAKFIKKPNKVSDSDSDSKKEMYLNSKIFAVITPKNAELASSKLSKNFLVETLDAGNTLCATYQGDYRMLEYQYKMLFNNVQMRKYKRDKKRNYQSVEIYLNNPNEVSPDELKTEVYVPIQ